MSLGLLTRGSLMTYPNHLAAASPLWNGNRRDSRRTQQHNPVNLASCYAQHAGLNTLVEQLFNTALSITMNGRNWPEILRNVTPDTRFP